MKRSDLHGGVRFIYAIFISGTESNKYLDLFILKASPCGGGDFIKRSLVYA